MTPSATRHLRGVGRVRRGPDEVRHMPPSASSRVLQDELGTVLTARSPAWDWNAELADGERIELDALRCRVADLRAETAQLRARADASAATAQDLRAALTRLATAGRRERRRVTAELRGSGLLP
jgi:hypothetical protein